MAELDTLDSLAFWGEAGGTVLGAFGSVLQSRAAHSAGADAYQAGKATLEAAEFEAGQLDTAANQAVGAGQRAAAEERRKGRLIQSRILALAAAGGGASDPTVMNLMADAAGEAEYRALLAGYEAGEIARVRRMESSARRYEGRVALQQGLSERQTFRTRASSTLLSGLTKTAKGASSLYTKYGMGSTQSQAPKFDVDWSEGWL